MPVEVCTELVIQRAGYEIMYMGQEGETQCWMFRKVLNSAKLQFRKEKRTELNGTSLRPSQRTYYGVLFHSFRASVWLEVDKLSDVVFYI